MIRGKIDHQRLLVLAARAEARPSVPVTRTPIKPKLRPIKKSSVRALSADEQWLRDRHARRRAERRALSGVMHKPKHGEQSDFFRPGIPVVFNGKRYPSIRAAAGAAGVSFGFMKSKLKMKESA